MECLSSKSSSSWKLLTKILLLLVSVCDSQSKRVWPGHYSEKHIQLHKEAQSSTHSHLQDFEVVIPSATNEDYHHVSHFLRFRRKNRLRRNVNDDVRTYEDDGLWYSLKGYGQEFDIHLKPNDHLLAPNFSIKRINKETEKQLRHNQTANCHYHGWLTSHQSRPVAMSTCNGLTGLLRTEDDDYLLEPVPRDLNHSFDSSLHPHLLYKRRHLAKGEHPLHYCGRKHRNPVSIPEAEVQKAINLLSNGEIELEDMKGHSKRSRRSIQSSVERGEREVDQVSITSRSRPQQKVVETMVVADQDMILKHQHDHHDVTTYVLTIMNMVSSLFSDHSLDGKVDFVLVGLILVEDNSSLQVGHKADVSLSNFCKWQMNLNQSEGRRPDHSILITGIDICVHKNSPCETLGLAQIGGMCNDRHSCTINEDMGLGLAFTIAHESGHSFGMKHDSQGNSCSKRQGHIMSPTLSGLNGVFSWSSCSGEALTDFLNDQRSSCLDDYPLPFNSFNYSDHLPGQIYGADQQCKWQFGSKAYLCRYRYSHKLSSLCKTLWCQGEGGGMCETKYLPAAEGTPCGEAMWCRRGVCVPYGSSGPSAIDGGWGNYGAWSSCTKTCGAGVQYRKRTCTNPVPRYGGRYCVGKSKVFQLCNIEKCSSNVDFRSQQCAEFNSKAYRRQYFNWVPFTKYFRFGRDSCNLLCQAQGYGFFDLLADKVIDGTPCDGNSMDVCIDGKCLHVGCDYVLGSNATFDSCGVCNGRNLSCSVITGRFTQVVNESGYYEVARIPRGARNVRISEERCCTHSYIAIKKATAPHAYYLNGNWRIDVKPAHRMAGIDWDYERKAFHKEYLYAVGHEPIQEDITVEVLVITENPGIKFSYSVDNKDKHDLIIEPGSLQPDEQPTAYRWNVSYGVCSSTCAGGTKTSFSNCMDSNLKLVDNDFCDHSVKPTAATKNCNTHACPARWVASAWSDCSQTCEIGVQEREVTCKTMTSNGDVLTFDENCDVSSKPIVSQSCQLKKCPAQWYAGPWTKCSRKCGRGRRKRRVFCQKRSRKVRQSVCDGSAKPRRKEKCVIVAHCPRHYQWLITNWTQCSSSCGRGFQRRKLKCTYQRFNGEYKRVKAGKCDGVKKPEVTFKKTCFVNACSEITNRSVPILTSPTTSRNNNHDEIARNYQLTAQWMAGGWQKCTVSCGGGVQVRAVKCIFLNDDLSSGACVNQSRPIAKRQCNTYQCSLSASNEQDTPCVDNFSWCLLVPQHGQCAHSYFGRQCCKSCSSSR